MRELDAMLTEAWNRVSERIRRRRRSALIRSRRRFTGVLTRPMREWCLVLRSSDTRLDRDRAFLDPVQPAFPGEHPMDTCRRNPGRLLENEMLLYLAKETQPAMADPHPLPMNLIEARAAHTLRLSGSTVRRLTRPIYLQRWMTISAAARLFGRDFITMKSWVHESASKGLMRVEYFPQFRFPPDCRRGRDGAARGLAERNGRPMLRTTRPLDPNNFHGRPPHEMFGTLWLWQSDGFPLSATVEVQREPRWRVIDGERRFRGWDFICPGRMDRTEQSQRRPNDDREGGWTHRPCGRRCSYLYWPCPVWTMVKALDWTQPFAMPEGMEDAQPWLPGADDPVLRGSGGWRGFACKTCWGVRSACMANANGWNEYITHLSGGLLYGRDVPRTLDAYAVRRLKKEYRRRRAAHAASTTTRAGA